MCVWVCLYLYCVCDYNNKKKGCDRTCGGRVDVHLSLKQRGYVSVFQMGASFLMLALARTLALASFRGSAELAHPFYFPPRLRVATEAECGRSSTRTPTSTCASCVMSAFCLRQVWAPVWVVCYGGRRLSCFVAPAEKCPRFQGWSVLETAPYGCELLHALRQH